MTRPGLKPWDLRSKFKARRENQVFPCHLSLTHNLRLLLGIASLLRSVTVTFLGCAAGGLTD